MRMTRQWFATLAVAMGSISCGGDGGGDATGPGGNGQFRFTARIDGGSWASTAGVELVGVPITQPGLYVLTGTQLGASGLTIILTLTNIPGPGTYPIGVGFTVAGGNALISSAAGGGWRTPQTGADGSITITTLTSSRMEGTFNFTATAFTGGATGTKTVTDGSFVLEVKPTGTVGPLPDNAGHKVTATLNGAAFNAAEAGGSYTASNTGILTVVGSNSTRSLALSLAGIPANATGTFALLNGSPSRTITMNSYNGTQVTGSYSSGVAGSSGSVVITSFTATRIKGTFTGTLGGTAGTTGTMTVTNGVFEIGRL